MGFRQNPASIHPESQNRVAPRTPPPLKGAPPSSRGQGDLPSLALSSHPGAPVPVTSPLVQATPTSRPPPHPSCALRLYLPTPRLETQEAGQHRPGAQSLLLNEGEPMSNEQPRGQSPNSRRITAVRDGHRAVFTRPGLHLLLKKRGKTGQVTPSSMLSSSHRTPPSLPAKPQAWVLQAGYD